MNGRQAAAIVRRLRASGFKLRYRDKRPVLKDWEHRATSDPRELAALWSGDANLGIACGPSGLAVVDLDPGSAEAFERVRAGRELPATYTVLTPRAGGRHLYFRPPPGAEIRNSQGRICPGVDVRGHGGYVVACASVVDSRAYTYPVILANRGRYVLAEDRDPVMMPRWLADLAAARPEHVLPGPRRTVASPGGYGASALAGEAGKVAAAQPGTRNGQLNASGFKLGQLVPDGLLTVDTIAAALMAAAAECGLLAEDGAAACERTLRGAIAAGMASPRQVVTAR